RGSSPLTATSRGLSAVVVKKSSAARVVQRLAPRPEPRTARHAGRDSTSYRCAARDRRSLSRLAVGAQYWEDWRLRARPASFMSHLAGGSRGKEGGMADDCRFFARLGAGTCIAGE